MSLAKPAPNPQICLGSARQARESRYRPAVKTRVLMVMVAGLAFASALGSASCGPHVSRQSTQLRHEQHRRHRGRCGRRRCRQLGQLRSADRPPQLLECVLRERLESVLHLLRDGRRPRRGRIAPPANRSTPRSSAPTKPTRAPSTTAPPRRAPSLPLASECNNARGARRAEPSGLKREQPRSIGQLVVSRRRVRMATLEQQLQEAGIDGHGLVRADLGGSWTPLAGAASAASPFAGKANMALPPAVPLPPRRPSLRCPARQQSGSSLPCRQRPHRRLPYLGRHSRRHAGRLTSDARLTCCAGRRA